MSRMGYGEGQRDWKGFFLFLAQHEGHWAVVRGVNAGSAYGTMQRAKQWCPDTTFTIQCRNTRPGPSGRSNINDVYVVATKN
jgi:hypothetical protein